MQTAIVTDSTADIPPDLATEYAIRVIPAILVIEGESLIDGIDISRREFYQRLPTMRTHPTTATPSPEHFAQAYKELFEQGAEAILSIHVASKLSGIYNTAKLAAQDFGNRVRVIDSNSLSMGIGLQVLAAVEAAAKNNPIDKIIDRIDELQQRVRVVAMLDTLTYIHRSGRVSWAKARIGSLLKIKPIVNINHGEVENLANTRTRRRGIDELKKLVLRWGAIEDIAVLHSNAEADAEQLCADIESTLSIRPMMVDITPVIGIHVGPNGLGIAAIVR
ncbi:MAG: DegV family protein [Chloroflexota bacterium]